MIRRRLTKIAGKRHGRGFTLAEILVALALIALLAAVLLPTVAGQILKGDASRVMQDLNAVRSGIDQFLADVHRYPGKYTDLSQAITTSKTDVNNAAYPQGLVDKWKGPYVTKDTLGSNSVETGFGGRILNALVKVQNTNAVNYVTVRLTGIAYPDFVRIDEQIDGTSTDSVTRVDKGLLRWKTAGGVDTTHFLATPIQ